VEILKERQGVDVMELQDMTLLTKQILVGVVATAVPLLTLLGGLHFTRKALTSISATEQA
jgi:hypothetical protein